MKGISYRLVLFLSVAADAWDIPLPAAKRSELKAVAVGRGIRQRDDVADANHPLERFQQGLRDMFESFDPFGAVDKFKETLEASIGSLEKTEEKDTFFFMTALPETVSPKEPSKLEFSSNLSFLDAITHQKDSVDEAAPQKKVSTHFFLQDSSSETKNVQFPLNKNSLNLPEPVPYNSLRLKSEELAFCPLDIAHQHEAMRGAALATTALLGASGASLPNAVLAGLAVATVAGLPEENLATLSLRKSGQFVFDRSLDAHNLVYPLVEQPLRAVWAVVSEVALAAQQAVEVPMVQSSWKAGRDPVTPPAVQPAQVYEEYELYGGVRITSWPDRLLRDVYAS